MLFQGGSPSEIIDLLQEFGVSSDVILALQIAYAIQSARNGTELPTDFQSFSQLVGSTNLTQIGLLVAQITAIRQGSQLYQQNQASLSELANQTGLN